MRFITVILGKWQDSQKRILLRSKFQLIQLLTTGLIFATNVMAEPIKLVALIPLSGGATEQATSIQRGLLLALEQLKASGLDLELIFEDSQGDVRTAVSAYKNLQSRIKFPVLFTWGSGIGMALSPLVNEDKVVQMGIALATPEYSSPADYTFRNFPSATLESAYTAETVYHKLKARSVLVLHIENDYGVSTAAEFEKHFVKLGGKILASKSFNPKEGDFRSMLTPLRTVNPDVTFISSYPIEGAMLIKQIRQLGIRWPLVMSAAILGGSEFSDIAGVSLEGCIVISSSPAFDGSNAAVTTFAQSYTKRFGINPDIRNYLGIKAYDALLLLGPILKKCNAESVCIKDELYRMPPVSGVGGAISFDTNGDVTTSFTAQMYRNGSFVPHP